MPLKYKILKKIAINKTSSKHKTDRDQHGFIMFGQPIKTCGDIK